MRLVASLLVAAVLAGLATAEPGGLDSAIDRHRQDVERQRGEFRGEIERQGRGLQQQQDQNLQLQLQLRQQQQSVTPPVRPGCVQVGGTLFCQ
jgi:septal ring factor EnvC (AmiA/AmiB activator)